MITKIRVGKEKNLGSGCKLKQYCCRDKQVGAAESTKGPGRILSRTFPGSVSVNSLEEQLPCLHTLEGARVIYMCRRM